MPLGLQTQTGRNGAAQHVHAKQEPLYLPERSATYRQAPDRSCQKFAHKNEPWQRLEATADAVVSNVVVGTWDGKYFGYNRGTITCGKRAL